MATYAELHSLKNNDSLIERTRVACAVAADIIRTEDPGTPNHANRMTWAGQILANPDGIGKAMLWAVLVANRDSTTQQIIDATDAQVQTAVDAAVDLFATG